MATSPIVEERHIVHHDESASSAGVVAIFLIAAVLIVGFLLFALNAFPFNNAAPADNGADINVTVPDVTPDTQPGTNIND